MGTATKSDTWRRWPVWKRMAVSRTYLMIQVYSHFFYWSIRRAFPSYQEREGDLSLLVLTTIFLTTYLHKEYCSHETHYVHNVWTIFKLFLLQLHYLNFTGFNYVLFVQNCLIFNMQIQCICMISNKPRVATSNLPQMLAFRWSMGLESLKASVHIWCHQEFAPTSYLQT